MDLSFTEELMKEFGRIKDVNDIVGRGSYMPSNGANSGSRKIMADVQRTHIMPLFKTEAPFIMTGRENKFAKFSSARTIADADYQVIAKINKFSFPIEDKFGMHYYLILYNIKTSTYTIKERLSYEYISESYGFIYNNDFLDSLNPGDYIREGEEIQTTSAYDEAGNRSDGLNLLVAYTTQEDNKEDAVLIRKKAARRFASPEIKPVVFVINDNDIPINWYGDDDFYQSIPNIGEHTKKGILCAIRKEKKDQALYSQSVKNLQRILMSDEKYTVEGTVIDINIICNNPKLLEENHHYNQLLFYHRENKRVAREVVQLLKPLKDSGYKFSPELQEFYYIQDKIDKGVEYQNEKGKIFSNAIIEITVLGRNEVSVGDKFANRYGGKGCISKVVDDDKMPMLPTGEIVDLAFNSGGVNNRENTGQSFESSINMKSHQLIENICKNEAIEMRERLEYVIAFLEIIAPKMGKVYRDLLNVIDYNLDPDFNVQPKNEYEEELAQAKYKYKASLSDAQIAELIEDICNHPCLNICQEPMSETMDLLKLEKLQDMFPFMQQIRPLMPQEDSNGNIRRVPCRREMTIGYQYIYRMKQYAEEKFSATSLTSVNIKNLPTRNNSKKSFKVKHSSTPIAFGTMESFDLGHIGFEEVIVNLLLNSYSPHGRRRAEELLTGDPYNIDLKLDDQCSNRGVEILNTYLLTKGLELKFMKKPKKIQHPILFNPISFQAHNLRTVMMFDIEDTPMVGYVDTLMKQQNTHITFDNIWFEE